MSGQTYGRFYENNSADYQQAKQLFDDYSAVDKSEEGIYQGLKGNTIKPSVLNRLKNDAQFAQYITTANKRIIREELDAGESLYNLPITQQITGVTDLLEQLGVNTSSQELIQNDVQLSSSSENYLQNVTQLNELEAQRKTLRDEIEVRFPNASANFRNAIFRRENGVLSSQIAELEGSAATNKAAYDFRL